jgi:hypothetical protein
VIVVASIVMLDRKFKIDDPVGAISVHGVAGIWGMLAVLLSNDEATLVGQLIGIGVIFAWVFGASLLVWFVLKMIMGIRVGEEEEYEGVDLLRVRPGSLSRVQRRHTGKIGDGKIFVYAAGAGDPHPHRRNRREGTLAARAPRRARPSLDYCDD